MNVIIGAKLRAGVSRNGNYCAAPGPASVRGTVSDGTCIWTSVGNSACFTDADCPAGHHCNVSVDGQQDASGYPCRDQVGRGPDQASAPLYGWNNHHAGAPMTFAAATGGDGCPAVADVVKANRDFFEAATGTTAARPASCAPLQGYFATDEAKLYQCTATNTWQTYYVPLAYPHPLVK